MAKKLNKSEQLYELAHNVLPYLGKTLFMDGKQYHLRVSPGKAEYVASSDDVVCFTGNTTLVACRRMLAWRNRMQEVIKLKNAKKKNEKI